jgi:hypothetical protein
MSMLRFATLLYDAHFVLIVYWVVSAGVYRRRAQQVASVSRSRSVLD